MFGLALAVPMWWLVYQRLDGLAGWLVAALGLTSSTPLGSALHFFFYDTVKILLLLSGIIFLVTVLRSFMSVERTRALVPVVQPAH